MGDSYPNFDDLSYTGLTDTGLGYTGSTTVQDVQLGSPLVLDTQYLDGPLGPVSNVSTPDFLSSDQSSADYFFVPSAQTLTGASDTPPSGASILASTPTPVSNPGSDSSVQALSALSKLGSAFAGLFGGQPRTVSATATPMITASGGQLPSSTMNGSTVLIMVIVAGALMLLLLRGD